MNLLTLRLQRDDTEEQIRQIWPSIAPHISPQRAAEFEGLLHELSLLHRLEVQIVGEGRVDASMALDFAKRAEMRFGASEADSATVTPVADCDANEPPASVREEAFNEGSPPAKQDLTV